MFNCSLIRNNFLACKEETSSNSNVGLPRFPKNSVDTTCGPRRSFKENRKNKKTYTYDKEETAENFETYNEERRPSEFDTLK